MTDPKAHGHKHGTPLRHWLTANLPEDRPARISTRDWSLAQRYIAGDLVTQMADDTSVTVEAITARLRTLARLLGYQSPLTTAWLLPDGRLADHAARRDEATGCLKWTGYLDRKTTGPYAWLPRSHWPPGHIGPMGSRIQIRQFLWENANGPVSGNLYVAAICGDIACIALDHAAPRSRMRKLSAEQIASTIERKDEESQDDAAARLGVTPDTIAAWRGPGGRKKVMASPLRTWLGCHLPIDLPAGTPGLDWSSARRYADGESLQAIATDNGLSRQAVQQRIRKLAMILGYAPEPDSTLNTAPTRNPR